MAFAVVGTMPLAMPAVAHATTAATVFVGAVLTAVHHSAETEQPLFNAHFPELFFVTIYFQTKAFVRFD